MKYAIIAAGEGSRLAAEGVESPKPLVKIRHERLIDRLIRVFMDNDAEEIVVICNDITTEVSFHLVKLQQDGLEGRPLPLRFIVKSTPSSMHSFFEISRMLGDGPFCLTTVDTIFREEEFARYIAAFSEAVTSGKCDGMMGVTDYIDDEKPLYVDTDDSLGITGFLDRSDTCRYISGGIYGLTSTAIETLCGCMERGESRMRNFQRALIADGRRLKAWPFSKVLDIDHATDIKKAEDFILEE
ncbi:sugar phosphate nucleotidyltransferase [Xylanibacter rodentium]|uniref:NTP transferase domain-containing protein n=1 Tax=Xylanibacter rodentium TaxID=2736289 RepID=A0ABX2AT03_9BACT|nr:sugar phosphate nucleotidyltransferase [Xylanibacter rodentium]NPE11263.1 NTP transferase domain-containing protein [Prevotella sp. PJ1A]NPE13530.1 NTP transferase domain-containing protein [Xylanibacter rodentium]NPE38256.1 NTP transferase domain-containing protein [Prevotella sp. PCJ2]